MDTSDSLIDDINSTIDRCAKICSIYDIIDTKLDNINNMLTDQFQSNQDIIDRIDSVLNDENMYSPNMYTENKNVDKNMDADNMDADNMDIESIDETYIDNMELDANILLNRLYDEDEYKYYMCDL